MHETVILDDVRTDGGTQPREYLNELVLSEYAESMTEGTMFPPVVIFFDGSHYWLADGFHRFFAAKKCGAQAIDADVRQGTRRDAKLYAVGANAAHGLRRTNADKRRAALTLLQDEEWQRWSNREIARQCGVTHTFVAKLRRELLGESPSAAPANQTPAARTEPMGAVEPAPPTPVVSPALSYTGDESFEAPATRPTDDCFDQLAPAEPASTMARLAFESPAPIATSPMVEPITASAPQTEAPQDIAVTPPDLESEAKLTIEAMAATSQQGPAEWVAEMMVYWLLDLGAQYEGMTPDLVRQAADKLGQQYAQACQEIAPSA